MGTVRYVSAVSYLYLHLGRHYKCANVNSIQVQFNFNSRPDLVKTRLTQYSRKSFI